MPWLEQDHIGRSIVASERYMKPEERVANALQSPDPAGALRSLVRDFSKEGRSKSEICQLLEQFVKWLRTNPEMARFRPRLGRE